MPEWSAPQKAAEITERRLLDAVLDGTFPVGSKLPPERELAEMLGVTRPTLREALQRLSREGWIEIHHGRSTRVRNYWQEGNLLILNPGQYTFGDFLRVGVPLTALIAFATAWMARWMWLDGPLLPAF